MKYKDIIKKIQELSKKNDNEMTVTEYKELQKLKKLLQAKKNRKVWILIMGGVIVIGVISVCMLTSCLSSNQIEPNDGNVTTVRIDNTFNKIKKQNTTKFVSIWNGKVLDLEYDYIYLKLNFEQYKIVDSNATENILSFLKFNKDEDKKLESQIVASQRHMQYIPIQRWIEERNTINYKKKKRMDSKELMEYLGEIVNPGKTFSNNTIDKIIQLNEFCYYFEKNKDKFYRDGYTRNIKSCSKIQEKLDKDGIDYRLK